MKILLLSASNNIHTIRWANALTDKGHDVSVACCKNHAKTFDAEYNKDVKIIKLNIPSPIGYYLNAFQLKSIVRKGNFDVINVHYASGYGTLGRMAGLKNALLNIWGSDVYVYPYKSKTNERNLIKNLKYYKYVASTSECMAKQSKKFVDREYFITPFGVNTQLFKPNLVEKKNITIGTVKTLKPIYAIDDSIKAFILVYNKLLKEGKKDIADTIEYLIYGRGDQQQYLQKLIDENGMSDKIRLCGYVRNENLPEVLNNFSVFCCCSHSESFGVAVVEAMACGVPVVTSDAEGFVEVVVDGVTGLIAPKKNVELVAEHLYALITNEELRTQYGISSVSHVKENYDWNDNVDKMIAIYKIIIENKLK